MMSGCIAEAAAASLTMQQSTPFRIGQFNVLCPSYGVKWGEREACADWKTKEEHGAMLLCSVVLRSVVPCSVVPCSVVPCSVVPCSVVPCSGGSNWSARWPAILRILAASACDVLTLQEVEESVRTELEQGLDSIGLSLVWFAHPGRVDAVAIAFRTDQFTLEACASRDFPREDPKATTGRVDLRHNSSGIHIRCLSTHQRGGNTTQLEDTFQFAYEDAPAKAVILVCGDFNEDFGPKFEPFEFQTLDRDPAAGEPIVSLSYCGLADLGAENSSGKGKIDYIFVKGNEQKIGLERSEGSRVAIEMSHAACPETGEWPSDHGMEALQVVVSADNEGCGC